MREKLAAQFPGRNPWDLKFAPGGLVDLEFIAQTLQLAAAHSWPDVLDTNTIDALRRLAAADCIDADAANTLIAAARLEHALTQVLRIALDGTLDPSQATPGLRALLARTTETESFEVLEDRLFAAQRTVRRIFDDVIR
jgi:glutamate-ammonia-ligase adenylyltransferase